MGFYVSRRALLTLRGDAWVSLRVTKAQPKGAMTMNNARKAVLISAVLGSMAAGGILGATVFAPAASNASTSGSTTASGGSGSVGTFHSNEDPAHEKTESAQREADENSGKGYFGARDHAGGAFHSNEDPAHEKTESAAREAEENAGQTPTAP
jgi:hypothetical protein